MKAALSILIFTVFAAVMVAAQDQPYFIIKPTPGEPVKAGVPFDFEWNNGADEEVTIHLLQGNGRESMLPTGTSIKADGNAGKVKFEIPADSDPKGNYAFRIDYVSDKGRNANAFSMAFPLEAATANNDATSTNADASAAESSEPAKSSDAKTEESSPAAKEEENKEEEEKKQEESKPEEEKKEEEKKQEESKPEEKQEEENTTSESQEEDEDLESAAVTFKLAASMMAVPAIIAGALLA
ncbi:hypothetical protein BDB00DRAFT_821272 [Zychaea mexicana]|uniref:uncharacterized protein n=1 Tax=Zychaea mexicana TaxID=64656 RepID=UPI0022FDEE15|nr:uncharacterized protein BDB00DRAFT_821272 [Zychaea mexicana]KAI9493928.1 hypothetical protein BDB00DRAFT_821272 [Zychaea mexicana]